jgi:hypothetical protein
MHEIDQKFFNEDGSINTGAAGAAGRKAQARVAGKGPSELKTAARQLLNPSASYCAPTRYFEKAEPTNCWVVILGEGAAQWTALTMACAVR